MIFILFIVLCLLCFVMTSRTYVENVNALIPLYKNSLGVEKDGDKLILKPVELIDLVIQEQIGKDLPAVRRRFKENAKPSSIDTGEIDAQTEDIRGDEERLRARKVWSRWGKWSDCSASCGGGTIIRRRLCVAGRCAPGELEEQQRPCAQTPCAPSQSIITPEDVRESE